MLGDAELLQSRVLRLRRLRQLHAPETLLETERDLVKRSLKSAPIDAVLELIESLFSFTVDEGLD
jgi:hypothetical protein